MSRRPNSNPFGSARTRRLMASLAKDHLSFLERRIDAVFVAAVDHFVACAERAANAESGRMMDIAVELRSKESDVQAAFLRFVRERFAHVGGRRPGGRAVPAESPMPSYEQLRILDYADVGMALTCERVISRASQRVGSELRTLRRCLRQLDRCRQVDERDDPFAPECIVESFRSAAEQLDVDLEARLAVLDRVDARLMQALPEHYRALIDQLAVAGVLPAPKATAIPAPAALERAGGSSSARASQAIVTDRPGEPKGLLRGASRLESTPVRRGGEATPGPDYVPRIRAAASGGVPAIDSQLLVNALTRLQQDIAGEGGRLLSGSALKRSLLELVRADEAEAPHRMQREDEKIIDAVACMFEFLDSDSGLPEPFKATLARLQIPVLKLALRDPILLTDPASPLKKMLDELTDAGMGWSRRADPRGTLLDRTREVVGAIVEDDAGDLKVIEEVTEAFRSFLQRHRRRAAATARREQCAVAGQERLHRARQEVGRVIAGLTRDRKVPDVVGEVVRRSWAHVMVLTWLQHGVESGQWRSVVGIARELVWSVTMAPEQANIRRLRTRLPVVARALKAGLRKVGYSEDELRQLMVRLRQLYADLLRQSGSDRVILEASREGLVIRGDDHTAFADGTAEAAIVEDDATVQAFIEQVRAWHPGQWVLLNRKSSEPVRAKLSWISPITGRYLFVDQSGARAFEASPAELAVDLARFRLQALDAGVLLSNAMRLAARELGVVFTDTAAADQAPQAMPAGRRCG